MLYINETWPLPKPNKGKHLQLRLANVYDFQSVMMVSADVYFGYDYLPYVYNLCYNCIVCVPSNK